MNSPEKRAACISKRPKSREETPKEGSDNARRYRTATICGHDERSARVFDEFPMRILHGVGSEQHVARYFIELKQLHEEMRAKSPPHYYELKFILIA